MTFALLVSCGTGEPERPGARDEPVEQAPSATQSAEDRNDRETNGGSSGERTASESPDNPTETAIALIQAFRNGNQKRAGELYPFRRWGSDEGFERMAEGYRELEFDLRPESIQVWGEGGMQVAVPATDDGTDWLYVFFVYEEDGEYKVDSVEARVAGVP